MQQSIAVSELLKKAGAAKLLAISPRTLDTWIARGLVPHLKIGRTVRFNANQLLAHLEKHNSR